MRHPVPFDHFQKGQPDDFQVKPERSLFQIFRIKRDFIVDGQLVTAIDLRPFYETVTNSRFVAIISANNSNNGSNDYLEIQPQRTFFYVLFIIRELNGEYFFPIVFYGVFGTG